VNVDAITFFGAVVDGLWVALVVAVGVFVLAAVWLAGGAVSRRLEHRYLPDVARWSRRRAGVPEDAGPWACSACHSVNASTASACYCCEGARPDDAAELVEAATDATVFHRPAAPNRFDSSMYRGPGAPPVDAAPGSGAPPAPNSELEPAPDFKRAPEPTPERESAQATVVGGAR
jgi:hypothetical protein